MKKIKRIGIILLCIMLVLGLLVVGASFGIRHHYANLEFSDYTEKDLLFLGITEESLEECAPINQKMKEAVLSLEKGDPNETWAVYIYMNGSDLESTGRDYLSDLTKTMIAPINEAYVVATETAKREAILEMSDTIKENGSSFPKVLTRPNYTANQDNSANVAPDSGNQGSADKKSQKVTQIEYTGMVNVYLRELMQCQLGDQVKVIVQPGGTTAWGLNEINPNMTQRFEIGNGRLNKVYEAPLQNMGKAETLTEFLTYCQKNYPADNTMVILWNHGGGYRGFGWDEIFAEDHLSIQELREGFAGAYDLNEENPPIDLLYMNACLMSNTDVYNQLRGVAKYMLGHEEVGLAGVDFYKPAFDKLIADPAMNPAEIGMNVVDSYTYTMNLVCEIENLKMPTNMVVTDITKAAKTYDAYTAFAAKALEAVVEDPAVLTDITRAAKSSIFFAHSSYKGYNTIDLKIFMQSLLELFPQEAQAVIDAIDEAVLYYRGNSYLKEAGGISVYYPANIDTYGGLSIFLDYVNDISENKDINALYYYKVAGCLNEELNAYLEEQGYGEAKALNLNEFALFETLPMTLDGNQVFITLTEQMADYTSDAYLQLAAKNPDNDVITYYGQDRYVGGTEESHSIYANIAGKWVTMDGVPLPVELVEVRDDYAKYQSHILHNGKDRYLIMKYDVQSKTMEIIGLRNYEDEANTLDRDIIELQYKDTIQPVYMTSLSDSSYVDRTEGKKIKYRMDTEISDALLPDGTYWARIVVEDLRCDRHYSSIIEFTMKQGQVEDIVLAPIGSMADVKY